MVLCGLDFFYFLFILGKPDIPTISEVVCEVKQARVKWKSSFNGGDSQTFTVVALNGIYKESESYTVEDKGENVIHSTFVQNLQPSTTYLFYVSAINSHGVSFSKSINCTTVKGKFKYSFLSAFINIIECFKYNDMI